ncbi:hypothetical protein ACQ23P_07830 [Staphylococcus cohnii]|uniref:Uncharacterized protein n=1 Tax=Staphylococcus cohnii TaxID=29382 RepID=A0A2T4LS50_9STAP|nr:MULTISPECIES: hypothetical protein [Staphylococcus]MBA1353911.1 hypothetical protein [Staphylococcus cohnii]MBA1390284.1 hypothetical protein [Staphylococcus cohnii]MBB2507262.1 hypothetical protein [Staphylococcus cohnii subsp. barensis]MBZ8173568.1 hypothetical protein [Staphylococcus cohnii]MCE5032891.1 hypothetical protein [Staphylococcus cohnii]
MNKRYIKVLSLYTISTLVPAMILNEKCLSSSIFKWLLRTLTGYGIFAYGLHILTKFKKQQ